MKKLNFILSLLIIFSALSEAASNRTSGTIIQVQRKIRMSDAEPLPPKEYFIDLGSRDGLVEREKLDVYRHIPVINGPAGAPWHILRVKIGELRVDYVGESSALAREVEGRDLASLPPLDYQTYMLGDEVSRKQELPSESLAP